jgi:hypothetical protein
MKSLILILAIALISCSDYEPTDNLAGAWSYESLDLTGAKPDIKASFSITPSGDSYAISNIDIIINGVASSNHTATVTNTLKGDKIGKLKFTNGDVIIEFTNMDQLGSYPSWAIEKVQMELGNEIFTYNGGGLKQPI